MARINFGRLTTVALAAVLSVATLSGCAAGGPVVVSQPTEEVRLRAAAQAATEAPTQPTESTQPTIAAKTTEAATAEATATAEVGPTPRPEPPENDGSGYSQVYDRGTSGRAEIALTFDAGADRGYAKEILDTLAEYGVKASFGITGHWADEHPKLVARMVNEGHMVFNHTWTHRSFTGYSTSDWDAGVVTSEERAKELADTREIIAEIADGYEVQPYFRPPYGDLDDSVLADVVAEGYWVTVMWTCDSLGWNGATIEQIVFRCGQQAEAGDIILMHVGAESLDAEALPLLIETLQTAGYGLVTVEELLQP